MPVHLNPTALIYSSHNRCEYLHRHWIVQRALGHPHKKSILYLPFGNENRESQEFSWSTFKWYFDHFTPYGLNAMVFFWNDNLSHHDAEIFFNMVENVEVVILGGGDVGLGFERYDAMGGHFFNDYDRFKNYLHQRQNSGKLTVGFSAGAAQLGDVWGYDDYHRCYALIHNVTTMLHHDWGREQELGELAWKYPGHMAFGLPNDSGIASNQGFLPSGNKWQILHFIIDNSWEFPEDGVHIKTRQGMGIEHVYHDGRRWTFHGGDVMARIFSQDHSYQGTWIMTPDHPAVFDYWSQSPSSFVNIDHIMAEH
jgi:hypothetical protein